MADHAVRLSHRFPLFVVFRARYAIPPEDSRAFFSSEIYEALHRLDGRPHLQYVR
jgi:hypothetical protein